MKAPVLYRQNRHRLETSHLRCVFLLPLLAAAPAHAKKRGPVLPKEFLGQWTAEKDKCDIQSESRLVIEPDFVMFYAAGYGVRRIVKRRDGSLKIFGPRADEGEGGSTPDSVEMKLISPNELRTNGSDRPIYYRCAATVSPKP